MIENIRKTDLEVYIGVGDNVFSCIAEVRKVLLEAEEIDLYNLVAKESLNKGSYSDVIKYLDTIVEVQDIDMLEVL